MVKMVLRCRAPTCTYKPVEDLEEGTTTELLQLLQLHVDTVHPRPVTDAAQGGGQVPATAKTEKVTSPQLVTKGGYATEEDWDYFIFRWEQYKSMVNLGMNEKGYLGTCLGDTVVSSVYGRLGHDKYTGLSTGDLLKEARKLVVRSRNKLVHRLKLGSMVQGGDEPVAAFETRLKPVARTGKFQIKCLGCNQKVDYTDEMVVDNLIRGLADEEVKKKVLAAPEAECTLDKVLRLVEAEESGKYSLSDSKMFDSVSGLSTFKKQLRDPVKKEEPSVDSDVHFKCGKKHKLFFCPEMRCYFCKEKGHNKKVCEKFKKSIAEKAKSDRDTNKSDTAGEANEVFGLELGERKSRPERSPTSSWSGGDVSLVKGMAARGAAVNGRRHLKHMRFDKAGSRFVVSEKRIQNRVTVSYQLDRENHEEMSEWVALTYKIEKLSSTTPVDQESIADTGATVVCGGLEMMRRLGLREKQLLPTYMTLFTADKKSLTVIGTVPVFIRAKCMDGSISTHRDMLYIVRELSTIFLSQDALAGLGVINKEFPQVQSSLIKGWVAGVQGSNVDTAIDQPCMRPDNYKGKIADCGCPVRELPPEPPAMPCPATEENREQLMQFLKDTYRSSTFNTCQHQPLPMMHGPPMELFVKEDVRPHQVYKPAAVPVHWEAKVKADLDRDVALGVLEMVPENTPITWCHRMVVCRKHNGDPRRTVDMQKLNDASVRQCHPTQPPLEQAMTVPHNTKKSVLDAWNGFHSVAIRETDRHLTTFCTMWGRYRYRSAPQGYAASGDAYTHRYDKITMGFKNIKRVIDDTLLHARDLEEAFTQVAEYLTLVGRNGIILNSDKFSFGEDTVDWAGIRITKDKVQPLPEHIKAIREFPTPVNITDMRSYWALVNQVSPYYCIRPHLEPFRELLKKNTPWYWDGVLQQLFEESREHIANEVLDGIHLFDKSRWTAVCPDWSKVGVGYFMSQKYCECLEITPICCNGGWKVCMVGSSFNSPAEANYAPIEGECLGVASSLHKTRYYTQGCDKLLVCTDHKPLLGVLNDREMSSMDSPRLMRLKEKTLGWRFRIIHIPGRKLCGPDALSRYVAPQGEVQMMEGNPESCYNLQAGPIDRTSFQSTAEGQQVTTTKEAREGIYGALRDMVGGELTMPDPAMDASGCMLASMELGVRSVSWDMVKAELVKDAEFKDLSDWISGGCVGPPESLPEHIRQYWRVRGRLRLVEMVPMLEDRTVVPVKLRKQVLVTLHSAHQGVLSMGLRAEQSLYWPGFWTEIERTRAECSTCQKIAPSQAKLPPVEPLVPNYPFEHICIDYMSLNGHEFGVVVDRYTGWPGVYRGSKGYDVTQFLAKLCEDYGVPISCTSDGGPNLTAGCVEDMMTAYGIHHRISSVGNPHANSRAELGVKTVKRMLRDNVGADGSLNRAGISRALLQLRNTPDRDTKLSPAKALFGRELRDFLPRPGSALMGELWMNLADARETALATRGMKAEQKWSEHTRPLPLLKVGDHVMVQNQKGNHPLRWDKRGTVVKCEGFDQYQVMIDGSRRLTRRNRKYLRMFTPYRPISSEPPTAEYLKTAITEPGRRRQPAVLPGHVQQEPQPVPDHVHPHQQQAQPWVQEDCPGQGIVSDMPDMIIPAAEKGHGEVHDGGQRQDDVPVGQGQGVHSPRRSTRAGRGQTNKYKDFVRLTESGASATYAQMVSGMGGRGHSW